MVCPHRKRRVRSDDLEECEGPLLWATDTAGIYAPLHGIRIPTTQLLDPQELTTEPIGRGCDDRSGKSYIPTPDLHISANSLNLPAAQDGNRRLAPIRRSG